MTAVAELAGVTKRFGAELALDSVDLAFPAGKTTAVIGESGSGKTTLLQLINAVEKADAGRVLVFGAPVPGDRLERFRRRIGYAVQGTGLFPHLTSRENVVLLAKLEGWTVRTLEDRYRETARADGLAGKCVDAVSGAVVRRPAAAARSLPGAHAQAGSVAAR